MVQHNQVGHGGEGVRVTSEPGSSGQAPVREPEQIEWLELGGPSTSAEPTVRPDLATRFAVVAPTALGAAAVAAVAVTFAPWLHTGAAHRTSYQMVRAADRLEVLSAGPQTAVSVAWAFLPFVAALAVVAVLVERRRIAAALAVLVGVTETFLALAVKIAPRSADWGTTAGLVLGSVLVVVALATAITARSTP